MKKIIKILTTVLFFIWILPLGVFIKAEQEKKACNGQRAICLCSHLVAKQLAKNAGKTFIQTSASASASKENSGRANHNFLIWDSDLTSKKKRTAYIYSSSFLYSIKTSRVIESVPKSVLRTL